MVQEFERKPAVEFAPGNHRHKHILDRRQLLEQVVKLEYDGNLGVTVSRGMRV